MTQVSMAVMKPNAEISLLNLLTTVNYNVNRARRDSRESDFE